MKTFETCPCGIAKVDCDYHKPEPEKLSRHVINRRLPTFKFRQDVVDAVDNFKKHHGTDPDTLLINPLLARSQDLKDGDTYYGLTVAEDVNCPNNGPPLVVQMPPGWSLP